MKITKPVSRAFTRWHAAGIATVVALVVAPVLAADVPSFDKLRGLVPTHAGWTLLAGIGLIAVGFAAFSVRRPRLHKPPAEQPPIGRLREASGDDARPKPSTDSPAGVTPPTRETAMESPKTVVREPVLHPPGIDAMREPIVQPPGRATPREPLLQVVASMHASSTPPTSSVSGVVEPAGNGSQLFLALQHVDLSIDVLRRHLQRESRPMPAVWLMLLDLCRTHGREQTFQELAIEFHRRFNVCTPAWEGFPPGRDDPGLEAYPRLIKEITLTWGTHECRRLLERLLYDNRGAQRRGFTLNAYNDLIALRRAADAVLDSIEKESAPSSAATAETADDDAARAKRERFKATPSSPLVSDLEDQLESDLRSDIAPRSAIETEHPALAGMIAREWGNAAVTARLCDMLARGGDSTHALSPEASEEIQLLRALAERLSTAEVVAVANDTR